MALLYNADCLQVLKDISSNSVDLIICDLPFGCLTNSNHKDGSAGESKGGKMFSATTGCSWDIPIDLEPFWKEIKRIRKDDHTPCLHFTTTKFGYELIKSNEKEFRYDLVWDKGRGVSFLSANKMPMRSHEMIYVFSKAGASYNRIDISGNFKAWEKEEGSVRKNQVYTSEIKRTVVKGGDGKRCPLSVIDISQKSSFHMKGQHPTEKPVELYKFLIERYCPLGGTVLDPTFGSGNSCLASLALKRKYIGIEKDKTFFTRFTEKLNKEPPS